MSWSIIELHEFLKADEAVRIMFVEGVHDLAFWRHVVPQDDREHCVVYPIRVVDLPAQTGGEKGRMVYLAQICSQWTFADRVIFFEDADYDRVLGKTQPINTVWTDGRDFESYALMCPVLDRLCEIGLCDRAETVRPLISLMLRPVAELRAASERNSLKLPFQESLKDGTLKRFFFDKKGVAGIKIDNLMSSLLNASDRLAETASLVTQHSAEANNLGSFPDEQLVHGKDLIAFLAWRFSKDIDAIAGMLRLAILASLDFVRRQAAIAQCENWLRQ